MSVDDDLCMGMHFILAHKSRCFVASRTTIFVSNLIILSVSIFATKTVRTRFSLIVKGVTGSLSVR